MSVLIGLVDQLIDSDKSATSWDVNKIGGTAAWLLPSINVEAPPCKLCGRTSTLVCQLYCPLGDSPYHRCLYIFSCVSKCSRLRKGWTVLRSMLLDETYGARQDTGKSSVDAAEDDWLDDQDDWGQNAENWGQESDDETSDSWNVDSTSECLQTGDSDLGPANKTPDMNGKGEGSRFNGQISSNQSGPTDCRDTSQPSTQIGCGDSSLLNFSEKCGASVLTEPTGSVVESGFEDVIMVHNATVDPCVDQQTEALSQLYISKEAEEGATTPRQQSGVPSETAGACNNVMNDVVLLGEKDRWSAMMKLLNTRHRQDSESSVTHEPSPDMLLTLKSYYLCVVDEPPGEKDFHMSGHVTELMQRYEQEEGVRLNTLGQEMSSKSKGGEAYEKTELRHGDKIFHKFLKRLRRCPEQCIRYDRGGPPLLISNLEDSVTAQISSCFHCGGARVFELQLLSPLIPWLTTSEGAPSPIEFGTILVYTCEKNCWSSELELIEEEVILQADPDQHLYR